MRAAMLRMRTQVLRAYRSGRRDFDVRRDVVRAIGPVLGDAMMVAQLLGAKASASASGLRLAYDPYKSQIKGPLAKYRKLTKKQADGKALNVLDDVSQKIQKRLRGVVADLIEKGAHVKEGAKALQKEFDALGITPKNGYQLETIFRTHTQLAYGAGRWQADQDEAVQEILWGYTYYTVGDDRVREEHAALDGVTLPKDHPLWASIWPPNGWNCRCQVVPVFSERDVVEPDEDDFSGPDEGFDFNPGLALSMRGLYEALALAWDPDQPRDEDGLFGSGGGGGGSSKASGGGSERSPRVPTPQDAVESVTVYHGTLGSNVESIMREGILPSANKRFAESSQGDRGSKVFATSNKAAAEWYGQTAALYGPPGSDYAVFEIRVPKNVMDSAPRDTSSVDSWMLDKIPPEWISEVSRAGIKLANDDDDDAIVAYVPLVFGGDDTSLAWDPDQPRDPDGKFGSGGGGRSRASDRSVSDPKIRPIERELVGISDMLRDHADVIDGASLIGSWASGNPDSKGPGTSDIDIVIHPKDIAGARRAAYDLRDKIVKGGLVSSRELHVQVGEISETFSKEYRTILGKSFVRGADMRDRLEERDKIVFEGDDVSLALSSHPYHTLMVRLPDDVSRLIIKECELDISDEELHEKGREDEPHVTIKYGIDPGVSRARVRRVVDSWEDSTIQMRIGEISVFELDDYDVVKLDVNSPDLHDLNELVTDELPCPGDTHSEYHPHITLAYVKKGRGARHAGPSRMTGTRVSVGRVTFSPAGDDRTKTSWSLV